MGKTLNTSQKKIRKGPVTNGIVCSITRKKQIESTMKYHCTVTKMVTVKWTDHAKCWWLWNKQKLPHIEEGNVKCYFPLWKIGSFYKSKHSSTRWPKNFISRYLREVTAYVHKKTCIYWNVHSSSIRYSPPYLATGQVPFSKRMTKQIVVCLCNGKLSTEKNGLLLHTLTWRNLIIIMLSQKCQAQECIYCMIPFTWRSGRDYTYGKNKSGLPWRVGEGMARIDWERGMRDFLGG